VGRGQDNGGVGPHRYDHPIRPCSEVKVRPNATKTQEMAAALRWRARRKSLWKATEEVPLYLGSEGYG
jgi:hypothetical protein